MDTEVVDSERQYTGALVLDTKEVKKQLHKAERK
jgi:hypothetical protein